MHACMPTTFKSLMGLTLIDSMSDSSKVCALFSLYLLLNVRIQEMLCGYEVVLKLTF